MGRWEPGTADRLRTAAIELFLERGYDATTVDDVAARAGVTQRTFFRHFADKEEVLFDADQAVGELLAGAARDALAEGPSTAATALRAARAATAALARHFDGDRDAHRDRAAVLAQSAALQGRQLLKQERWMRTMRSALEASGIEPGDAAIAVEIAAGALRVAYAEWLAGRSDRRLVSHLRDADTRTEVLLAESGPAAAARAGASSGRPASRRRGGGLGGPDGVVRAPA